MDASELALWRYSVIAPLLHRPPSASLSGTARDLATQVKQRPDGLNGFLCRRAGRNHDPDRARGLQLADEVG